MEDFNIDTDSEKQGKKLNLYKLEPFSYLQNKLLRL